jgi:hypothetical protein
MGDKIFSDNSKTFSEYRMRRRRTALLLSLPQALPLPLGEFFDQRLHLLVVLNRLADAFFPSLGDTNLAGFSLVALDKI